MEKLRPTYDLRSIQKAFELPENLNATTTALVNAAALGFDAAGIVDTIATITPRMFQKSMTTYADHKLWQDVYFVPAGDMVLYVKFQAGIMTEFTLVSFKER
jgi:motility quorum-sensing regulator / GCU-specific mRNA interferase toxin